MKRDPIALAYSGLTGKEQANLVMHYANRGDELEVARVLDAIPRVDLQGPPIDFIRWSNALMRLAAWWGIEYWKAQCRRSAAMGGILLAGDKHLLEQFRLAGVEAESLLLALNSTLNDAANLYGFDSDAIRSMCHAGTCEPKFITEADPAAVQEVRGAIQRILALE